MSAKTHGTFADFEAAWEEFIKTNDPVEQHPVIFAIGLHDIIIQHMPFFKGNRRLARILMADHLVKCGIYPPLFWSDVGYEKSICADSWIRIKGMKDMELADYKARKVTFLSYIVSLIAEAESISLQKIQFERPRELWEILASRGDYSGAMFNYIKRYSRVLVSELLNAMNVFAPEFMGKEVVKIDDQGHWIWSQCSKDMTAAIEQCLKNESIQLVDTYFEEYNSRRCVPNFHAKHPKELWKPSVLVYKPVKG